MGIIKLALTFLFFYFMYKFIFEFIVPIYKTTSTMSKKMKDMQDRMRAQEDLNRRENAPKQAPPTKAPAEGYIDYEEVK